MAARHLHLVFDDAGRILAAADAAELSGPGGLVFGHEPVLRPGQYTSRFTLDEMHEAAGLAALVRDFEVDTVASPPALRRRPG